MIIGSLITVAWDTGGNVFTDALGRLWKRADGSSLLIADYPDLYALIGTRYGSATALDFKLPNFTTRFLRGWDPLATLDVDSASRTIPGPGATSADAGTVQPEIIRQHSHGAFPQGRFVRTDIPGTQATPGGNQIYGSGPNFPSPTSATTISGIPTNRVNYTPDGFKPYHMVVDFLIRIK